MLCYRLFENLSSRSPLGFGLAAGRWNHPGTPMIYASNSIALPFLELYSIHGSIVAESSWILACVEISDDLPYLDVQHLTAKWNERPPGTTTKNFGSTWARAAEFPFLKVPSARIPLSAYPDECNILINPLRPDFKRSIKIISKEVVAFSINLR